ncbi:hypothetical protein [Micrococcus lylae]|uniref:hypothetical protein n=1 Tax=Micrococcus lylae TaxID=1273 RepID=UPI00117D7FC5|nr:hypothetical protein [Micrococcus lylae]
MTGRARRVHLVAVGPAEHGVTRHALQTAARAQQTLAGTWDVELVRCPDADAFRAAGQRLGAAAAAGGAVHVDVTDALFGDGPAEAAAVLRQVLPASATIALHDVPQPAEGAARYAARAAAYAELARSFAAVVVASEHEAGFLRAACADAEGLGGEACGGTRDPATGDDGTHDRGTGEPAPIAVVPLPVPDARGDVGGEDGEPEIEGLGRDVVVLGHLYPGKGHAEAIAALAAVRGEAVARGVSLEGFPDRVTALGPVAAGHDDLVAELERAAADEGLAFRVTGFVPDEQLPAALAAAAVPFAAHRNVSASGSLATWMGHGRQCIVPAGAYVEEMDALRPGTLHVARPGEGDEGPAGGAGPEAGDRAAQPTGDRAAQPAGEDAVLAALTRALAAAVADPSLTRLAPDVSLAPTPEDTVRALAEVWSLALECRRPVPAPVEGGGRDD